MKTSHRSVRSALVVSGLLASALATKPAQAEPMDLAFYKTYVNRENCLKSQQNYLACISSLQVLMASLDPELHLKTQTTSADFLKLNQTRLALNANNVTLVHRAREATFANKGGDVELSQMKEFYLENKKTKVDFKETFGAAYYHFKVASNDVIGDVIRHLDTTYLKKLKPETSEAALVSAVNEYIHVSRDPHSDWRLEEDTQKSMSSKEESFAGLGIRYVPTRLGATIEFVINGSGAQEAGLQADDTILAINGTVIKGLGREAISALIRGPVNGSIDLQIKRQNQALNIRAYRREVKTPVVSSTTQQIAGQTVGLIKLENFTYSGGCEDIATEVEKFKAQKIENVLLDLRGNGGGSLTVTECIAGLFLGPGKTIAYREQKAGGGNPMSMVYYPPASQGTPAQRAAKLIQQEIDNLIEEAGPEAIKLPDYQNYLANLRDPEALKSLTRAIELYDHGVSASVSSGKQIYDGKLAVLIDAYSASASELLSGAFRDWNRALVVGQTSFGKGSVQSAGSARGSYRLWQTEGLFFQPSGTTNQTVGVKPHIEVYRDLQPSIAETYQLRERDLFLYPLEPRSISYLVPEAATMNQLKVPSDCLETKNTAALYQDTKPSQWRDMQVLTAANALLCQN